MIRISKDMYIFYFALYIHDQTKIYHINYNRSEQLCKLYIHFALSLNKENNNLNKYISIGHVNNLVK